MITLTGMKQGANNSAQITAFADNKADVGGSMSIIGLPEGLTLSMGSAIFTAAGEVAFLKSDGTWNWVANAGGGGGGGASSFAELDDVDISSPSDGQVATYNGTSEKWENKAVPTELPPLPSGNTGKGWVLCINKNKQLEWSPVDVYVGSENRLTVRIGNVEGQDSNTLNTVIPDIVDTEMSSRLLPRVEVELYGNTVLYCAPETSNTWTMARPVINGSYYDMTFDENI